jgi:hypothetical protein
VKAWLERTPFGCKPADDDSAAVLKRIPLGTTFEADVITKKSRSGAWHRRYWLLMSMLASHVEAVEIEPGVVMPIRSAEDAHAAIKYATGLYDQYVLETGIVRVLKSTAFDKMDADQWAAYYPRVLDAVHQKFLPGVALLEVEAEIARMAS